MTVGNEDESKSSSQKAPAERVVKDIRRATRKQYSAEDKIMRYPASEKIEIIRLVEQSALLARKTLERLGVPRATFYRWYDQYRTDGPEALEDRPSRPSHVWNRIPEEIRSRIVELALEPTSPI